jgi:hypothetical protein
MSLESILKEGAAKARKKKPRKTFGGINAVDSKYTGEEPVWDNWESWPIEKFWKEYTRSFNFYNYYSNSKDSKAAVLEWMVNNGYSKNDIRAVKSAPDYFPGMTAGTLCTCMNRGMPAQHPDAQAYLESLSTHNIHSEPMVSSDVLVKEKIAIAISEGRRSHLQASDDTGETVPVKSNVIPPMVRLQNKCMSTIIMDLDLLMDEWCDSGDEVRVIPIYKTMQIYELPAASCPQVETYLEKWVNEMLLAASGEDDYMSEGYSYLSKKQLNSRIAAVQTMLDDLQMFKNSAKASRKPREKKPTAATKQIAKMKYMKHSNEFKITSINPIRIIGAHRFLAFNVKTRMLFDYGTSATVGFIIKGTTIQNLDETMSRCIRLRKPEEFLQIALNNTANQFEKAWNKLTTKESKPNGRINDDIILLRVF